MKVKSFISDHGGASREARETCARCEVKRECLEFALEHPDLVGVWGGTGTKERSVMREWTT